MEDASCTRINPFIKMQNIEEILSILEARLPKSAHIFNMALKQALFTEEMSFYILDLKTGKSNLWIVAKYEREDRGTQISISIPNECKWTEISPLVESVFKSSGLIQWDKQYEFQAIDRNLSRLLINISLDKENAIEVYPCNYFYLEPEEAKQLNTRFKQLPPEVTLKSLNSETGIKFLAIGGPNTTEAAMNYIRKTVERNDYSLGIFVEEEPVSRICVATTGHMGFLMTLDSHRRKGYSTICLQRLTHKLGAESKLYPCAMVDLQNKASNGVHIQAGLKLSHIVDFIIYKGNQF